MGEPCVMETNENDKELFKLKWKNIGIPRVGLYFSYLSKEAIKL